MGTCSMLKKCAKLKSDIDNHESPSYNNFWVWVGIILDEVLQNKPAHAIQIVIWVHFKHDDSEVQHLQFSWFSTLIRLFNLGGTKKSHSIKAAQAKPKQMNFMKCLKLMMIWNQSIMA